MKTHLNNKGYMLIEIVLAMTIAMVVVYFITNLTIKIKNKNDDLLVKTLVATDQAIIYNAIMKDLYDTSTTFTCSKINISGNTFKYGSFTNIISEYATIGNMSCSVVGNKVNIKIPIIVKQLPDDDFSVNIVYNG